MSIIQIKKNKINYVKRKINSYNIITDVINLSR